MVNVGEPSSRVRDPVATCRHHEAGWRDDVQVMAMTLPWLSYCVGMQSVGSCGPAGATQAGLVIAPHGPVMPLGQVAKSVTAVTVLLVPSTVAAGWTAKY